MEQTADPDTVRISGNTYKSVSNLFHFNALGDIEVQGKADPCAGLKEVLGVREGALPTRGIEGLASPMVGRTRELAALQATMEDVTAGLGRVAAIMGEAGLGKSRLVAELRNNMTPGSVSWYEGRSLSYETSTPYAPFIDMFGLMVGLRSNNFDAERYTKVKAKVDEVMPGKSEEIAPFLATMLGIDLEGDANERVRYLDLQRGVDAYSKLSLNLWVRWQRVVPSSSTSRTSTG